jgi:glycerophosphoryl diester phosphodiesterase
MQGARSAFTPSRPAGRATGPLLSALALTLLGALLGPAAAAAGPTDWTKLRTLNITHQGGEDEAPSATMHAFARSMKIGSDMLEVDIHATSDDRLAIIHDSTVDRTTNGTGMVSEMTMAELRRLDAAHWFVPGTGTTRGAPERHYVFRGVRTGERRPPPGYRPRDFRILELDELISRYPDVPINIEIKGSGDANLPSFLRNAEVLAAYLNDLGRTEGIMVASFNDAALEHFHQLAPEIDLAPAVARVAAYKLASAPLPPGIKAFQVPIEFGGITVTDQEFVDRAHADGYGVHVWTINDEDEMRMLLGYGVDGIMTAEPARLERVLCAERVQRPPLPASVPGRHCSRRASIACEVRVTRLARRGPRARVGLARTDTFGSRCAGTVTLRAIGTRAKKRTRFNFGWQPTSEGSPARTVATARLGKRMRRAIRRKAKVRVVTRPFDSFARQRVLRSPTAR